MSQTPTIGGIQFASLEWPHARPGKVVEKINRKGVAGTAIRVFPVRTIESQAVTMADFDSVGARTSAMNEYMALQGTYVTIVSSEGETTQNVAVVLVTPIERRTMALASGGLTSGRYVLRCRWDLQQTDTT